MPLINLIVLEQFLKQYSINIKFVTINLKILISETLNSLFSKNSNGRDYLKLRIYKRFPFDIVYNF